ncbi:MAG: acyl carrier protein [Pseudomonadales bacterium]|nr:acyl carrier protein [Pseudomonadales bacterium]
METKEQIFSKIKEILIELFEIEEEDIEPGANLYEELDIDSIDAVDLVVKLKEITGKKIQPEEFKTVRTVQDVVDAVHGLLAE